MDSATIAAIGSLIAAIATLITALNVRVTRRAVAGVKESVAEVHREVKTGNGQTIGMLADIAEGRAAEAIPTADRTAAEQLHADMKQAHDTAGGPA